MAPNKAALGNTERADRRKRDVLVMPEGCASVLAHVPSFGRNPRGSPDFLAYPVPKACMHVLGTGVLRCLGVARSASESQSSEGLGMQPYPRAPDPVLPGHLHGTGCLSARAMDTRFRTVVWRLCLGLGFAVTPPILAGV